ncbi:MAG: hypothetical protein J4G09_04535 [Proteobacteria bacterium]|nr:hypothetical protein [Pseudomonadota bacterium]
MTRPQRTESVPVTPEDIELEGVWLSGPARPAVVAPPHPVYGGHLDHPVCVELAGGLHGAGYSPLRFNWRGVGASQGSVSGDFEAARRDYAAALDHATAALAPPALAAGYSFGAAAALRVGLDDDRVGALLLVSPPAAMLAGMPLEVFEGPLWAISGGDDEFSPAEKLTEQIGRAPRGELRILPGVDHFFSFGGIAEVREFASRAEAFRPPG